MKKTDKPTQEQQPKGRAPKQSKGVTELTDQELDKVQGGVVSVTPQEFVIKKDTD
jgi:bacteriocin-like protein